jgi:colicin import membrane protein
MENLRQFSGAVYDGFAGSRHKTTRMAVYLIVSVLAHALFLLAGIWLVHFEVPGDVSRVVQVDLVSFAPGEPGGREQAIDPISPGRKDPLPEQPDTADEIVVAPDVTVPEPPEPPEPQAPETPAEPDPVAVLKPDVSLKTKPKNLEELMVEQRNKPAEKKPEPEPKPKPEPKPDPGKDQEKTRQELADKMEAQKKEQLARAMERMARTVEKQDKQAPGQTAGTGTGSSTGTGPDAGMGRKGATPIDLYKMVLQSAVQQNWVFNEMLAGMDQNLEVSVLIKILKNGEIRDIVYETRSGNRYLDQSAKRAIQRSSPLPPLPKGMASYDVLVIFTPKGLR